MAGELALHFERGQDARRAVQYQQYAAEQALSRSAYTEALAHCQQGLDLLATLPESPERAAQELTLRLALSIALVPTQGHTSEELAHNLQHALALCDAVEATTALVPVLVGLTRLSMVRADRAATERLMARERALLLHKPRHDLRYLSVHFSRPYRPVKGGGGETLRHPVTNCLLVDCLLIPTFCHSAALFCPSGVSVRWCALPPGERPMTIHPRASNSRRLRLIVPLSLWRAFTNSS